MKFGPPPNNFWSRYPSFMKMERVVHLDRGGWRLVISIPWLLPILHKLIYQLLTTIAQLGNWLAELHENRYVEAGIQIHQQGIIKCPVIIQLLPTLSNWRLYFAGEVCCPPNNIGFRYPQFMKIDGVVYLDKATWLLLISMTWLLPILQKIIYQLLTWIA